MKKIILALAVSAMLSGCVMKSTAHAGKDFDETKISQIVSKQTTEADLLRLMGEPVKKEIVSDNEVKWTYEYVTSNAAVRMFSTKPKVDVSKKVLEVLIRDGVVVNHAYTNPGTTTYK
ncbi:hypothetical protein [Enterobacter cloacae]|uniref:hypothetical protein n=1 Tax=Enterobacter cloacae TaxID=550 RepID=UPI001F245FE3|nr:hypothetical protein [Enterobacter cloacae]MCK6884634.1 hypothetical protein [Enterobacter cloacae]MCK7381543.1 hypothetical protein [Enterobacter cloacae]MDK9957938.1 hypothetical protein [Enterobacter cloacae]HAV2293267.1 hypothetical protein [Enterobacter cloacae]HAV2324760.1 hypothetical protein [Enterobacter cloacae]